MKKTAVLIFTLIILSGCGQKQPPLPVTINIGGQAVLLYETAVGNHTGEYIDLEAEKVIFAPILEEGPTYTVPLDSELQIFIDGDVKNVTLYDHLIKEDGSSHFNRMIIETMLDTENGRAAYDVTQHISVFLSSNSEFLSGGSIRGFRLQVDCEGELKEYAFVLYIE